MPAGLLGTRLSGVLVTDILAKLQANFPISGTLLPVEQAALATYQQKFADAVGTPTGADVVTEIKVNALVATTDAGSVTSGPGSGGAVVATGTGTVS